MSASADDFHDCLYFRAKVDGDTIRLEFEDGRSWYRLDRAVILEFQAWLADAVRELEP